jgi:osmotically-inducible protein OsmY
MCHNKNRPSARRADHELAMTAQEAIKCLTTISQKTVRVTAHNGHLDLDGRVASLQQRLILEDLARTLPGVRGITNLICVEADPYFALAGSD